MRDKKPKTIELTIVEQPKSMTQSGEEEAGESAAPAGVSPTSTSGNCTRNWPTGMG